MNLICRANQKLSVLLKNTVKQPPSILRKNLQTTAICSEQRKYTKKVFQPAFGESEAAKIEEREVIDTRKTPSDLYLETKVQKKKVRNITKLDKLILVKLGKYKRVEDVPDQITFKETTTKKEMDDEIKQQLLNSVFKYGYTFEYVSTVVTGGILIFALYWYKVHKQKTEKVENIGAEPVLSVEQPTKGL